MPEVICIRPDRSAIARKCLRALGSKLAAALQKRHCWLADFSEQYRLATYRFKPAGPQGVQLLFELLHQGIASSVLLGTDAAVELMKIALAR